MLRPKPVPFGFRFLLAVSFVNGANSFVRSSLLMPHPESFTSSHRMPEFAPPASFSNLTTTSMVPFDVNLIALPM